MKVLHINSYYNGCPFYRNLYDAQVKLGMDIQVFVPMPKGDKGARADYGPYTDVSEDHLKYDRAIFQIKHAKILKDAMQRYGDRQFDMIHAHSLFSNGYIAMKLSERTGAPYMVAVRDTDVNVFFAKMPHLRALGRRILSGAAKVIFLSKSYRDQALQRYLTPEQFMNMLDKCAIIPNGIDPFWHKNQAQAHPLQPGKIRLISVGRASKRKNIRSAVNAAKLLIERGIDVQFDIVIGVIEDEGILSQLQAPPFVTLHQQLTRDRLLPLYRTADIFILPSLTETFGIVYPEAMSQGLPVIYTKDQGFDGQFAQGEIGYAVDPMDADAMADAIQRIIANYGEISARCPEASAVYNWDDFAAQYLSIYREAGR